MIPHSLMTKNEQLRSAILLFFPCAPKLFWDRSKETPLADTFPAPGFASQANTAFLLHNPSLVQSRTLALLTLDIFVLPTLSPLWCPVGLVCSADTKSITECPTGFYCPGGTVNPINCIKFLGLCVSPGYDGSFNTIGFLTILLFTLAMVSFFKLKNVLTEEHGLDGIKLGLRHRNLKLKKWTYSSLLKKSDWLLMARNFLVASRAKLKRDELLLSWAVSKTLLITK